MVRYLCISNFVICTIEIVRVLHCLLLVLYINQKGVKHAVVSATKLSLQKSEVKLSLNCASYL